MPPPSRPLLKSIDFHAHFSDPVVFAKTVPHNVMSGFGAKVPPPEAPRIACQLDPQLQVADMDRRGIDVHVISSSQVIVGTWWAEAKEADELLRRQNDRAAEWVARYPQRFVGAFDLPLQDLDLALRELERATDQLGLKVANLPAGWGTHYLGDAPFHPLLAELERRNVLCFIHPDGTKDPWYQAYGMWNSIGQSIEEVKVMTSIIYNGVFEIYPALRIIVAHGGGFLPHNMARLDRNVTNLPFSTANISRKPSEYLRNFYYDTCVYNVDVLAALAQSVGTDRLVMGGDYPVGNDPLEFVRSAAFLSAKEREAIVVGNAAALLGL
jgi:aminocarboxymuconate-semialdehyde decarboxylase